MPFTLDPEVAVVVAPMLAALAEQPHPEKLDPLELRALVQTVLADFAPQVSPAAGITKTDWQATAPDGAQIPLRWFATDDRAPGPAAVFIHGGGMISGSVALQEGTISGYVAGSGVPLLAVDYRLAPEHPHPGPVEDCYAALCWLAANAGWLGVDPARIAVLGESAGGGLAAAVALLARDRGGPLPARQILIYPMLDDRTTTPDPELAAVATWTYEANVAGWTALLGAAAGGPDTSPYAAPARAADLSGLPPAYLEVGQLDIFRDEDLEYARRLGQAGVEVELHVHPGAPHAFEAFAPAAAVSRRAMADRARVLAAV